MITQQLTFYSAQLKSIALIGLLSILVQHPSLAAPKIERWKTANGIPVLFIESHSLPIIDIRVLFSAGSARDEGKPGLALLTNALLTSGAGDLNANDIAAKLEGVGAILGNDSLRDMSVLSLRSLSEPDKLNTALQTMQLILSEPSFPAADLERDRQRLLLSLKHKQQQPSDVSQQAFYQALFGTHPYAHPSTGTVDSVPSITREDLQAFHRRYYVAANSTIAIVGDLNRKSAEKLANELTQNMPTGKRPADIPAVTPLADSRSQHIDLPTTQTHILVGQPGMRRGDPDYFALYVGNHILGGSGFASRLVQEIREDRGLAYSVYSYFISMAAEGPFIIGMQTRNEQTDQALALLKDNLRRFVDEGPTEKELTHAIKNITGSFPLKIDSNSKLVEYLAMIGFYQLPLDYLDTFNEQVASMTAEKIQDAFQRKISPDKLVTVTAGGTQKP